MKKHILLFVMVLLTGMAFSATVTISNSSFSFSPGDVTINSGDTVVFSLGSIHNAIEVSEQTWNSNGNTPLPGGFSVGFGGGTVTGLSVGVHYYVCAPHASSGMKGKITVTSPTGIPDPVSFQDLFQLYPNPTRGKVNLKYLGNAEEFDKLSPGTSPLSLEILSIEGKPMLEIGDLNLKSGYSTDLSTLPAGNYLIWVTAGQKKYTTLLVKE